MNNRKAVATVEGGSSSSQPPDVCHQPLTPPPPSPPLGVPVPYKDTADNAGAKRTTTKVLVRNMKCLVEGSYVPRSSGDERGCCPATPTKMGIMSMKHMDKCEFPQYSAKVKMEGKGAIYHSAMTKHNAGNTIGKHDKRSQGVVFVHP